MITNTASQLHQSIGLFCFVLPSCVADVSSCNLNKLFCDWGFICNPQKLILCNTCPSNPSDDFKGPDIPLDSILSPKWNQCLNEDCTTLTFAKFHFRTRIHMKKARLNWKCNPVWRTETSSSITWLFSSDGYQLGCRTDFWGHWCYKGYSLCARCMHCYVLY